MYIDPFWLGLSIGVVSTLIAIIGIAVVFGKKRDK